MSNCFSCFTLYERRKVHNKKGESEFEGSPDGEEAPSALPRLEKPLRVPIEADFNREGVNNNIQAQTFNFRELASATKNFRQETLLGEGGFGRVYKGQLHKIGQTVAVKQLDRNGMQGNKEFLVEVLMLSNLHHQNLVNLIGYCADGDQRLLVYEFMSLGSLEDHLLDLKPEDTPLNWCTRLKIALGAAKGLEYLHDIANPPVIYRDLKSSNILLDEEYNAKLSDFGLAKLGPLGEKTHVSSRVMGTYGYCAPEYQRTGHLTLKSDIYSYGVVLLEIISGRRAIDPIRPINEQNLVSWAEPYFRDPSKFPLLADPLLQENYPIKSLNQVVAIAAMCLQDEASVRPLISDVVTALSFLGMAPDQSPAPPHPTPLPESASTPAHPEPTPAAPSPTLAPDHTPHPTTDLDPPQLAPILIPPLPAPAPSYDVVPQPAQPQPPASPLAHVPDLPQPISPVLAPVLAPASSVTQVPTSPHVASAPKLAPIMATVLSSTSPLAQIHDSPQAHSPAPVLVPVLASASAPAPAPAEVVAAAQASSPYLASELAPAMASIPSSASPVALAPVQASPLAQVPSSPQSPSPVKAPDSPLAQVPASPSFLARAPYLDPAPMHDGDKGENSTESDSSNDDTDESESGSENEDCEEEVENAIEWGSTSRNAHQRFLVATDA